MIYGTQQSAWQRSDRSSDHTRSAATSLAVAVLGAGHGGMALAGYLGLLGHRVTLWNRTAERISEVAKIGGVRLTSPGQTETFAPIANATSHISAGLADAEVILVALPASGHADVARACIPYLRDGQTILLLPGRTGGALEFRRTLLGAGCRARVILGEASTFPFAARITGQASATIYGTKREVRAAALPATQTPELISRCRPLLPMLAPAGSVLETSFSNFGAILHPTITLLNATRITRAESFDFYAEGVTPHVANILEAADAERLQVARAYGVAVESLRDWIAASYGHHAQTLFKAVGGNQAYVGIKAPTTLQHRYLTEDVPTGLMPLLDLGAAAGVAMPTFRDLVDLARATLSEEYWGAPRTLESLGLSGRTGAEIRDMVAGVALPARVSPAVRPHAHITPSIPTGV